MKMQESIQAVQSELGQSMAGIQMPLTGWDIPVPIVDYTFENKLLAGAAIAAAGFGLVKTLNNQETTRNRLEIVDYTQGSDASDIAKTPIIKKGSKDLKYGLLATTAAVSGLFALANPYSEDVKNEIGTLAVVIPTDLGAFVEDVATPEGNDSRLDAIVNAINYLDLDGIDVEYIGNGTEPLSMGIDSGGDNRQEIVDNFSEYARILSNRGSVSNDADYESALALSGYADKIIVFGNLEGDDQSPILDGESAEDAHKVIAVSVGNAGSIIDDFGVTSPAPFNPAFNELVVGPEDNYTASSEDEIKDIVKGIVDDQIQTKEKSDVKFFDNIVIASSAVLVALSYLKFGRKPKKLNPVKGK